MVFRFRFALAIFVTVFAFSAPVHASDDSHTKITKELLTFLKARERMQVAVKQIVQIQIQRDPRLGQFQPQIEAFVAKHLAWETLEPEIIAKYKETFSEQEVRDILDFYRSETGRKALANMERIIREVGKSQNDEMQRNSAELRAAIEEAQRKAGGAAPKSQ